MSKVQRERLDAQLRGTGVGYEQSVGESRENFAQLMNALPVPEGIRVHETSLGGRPALRVIPDAAAGSGTLLYLHGGSHVVGSPRTALGLTADLVVRTGIPAISLDYRLALSSISPRRCRTCSSHSPAYSTRPARRLTEQRSSCASTSTADAPS
jgi:monoterpene epsilon-lactone hydrolase